MAGVAVHAKDRAGGAQDKEANTWFRVGGEPVVVIGDTVAPHGDPPHAPSLKMVEGTSWFRINGKPVCHAGHKAECGHATTGRYWFQIYDKGERRFLLSPSDPCNVEHIPAIMRAQDPQWNEPAMLLERWFDGKASADKSAVPPETTIVTMDYVLSSRYPKMIYENSLNPRSGTFFLDADAERRLEELLRASPDQPIGETPGTFDFIAVPPIDLLPHAIHEEFISLKAEKEEGAAFHGEILPSLNSVDAALGNYHFYYNVAGKVVPLPSGAHEVIVESVGVYVQDSFDFDGLQYLGNWDIKNHELHVDYSVYAAYAAGLELDQSVVPGCVVTNRRFRSWREATGHGQDFTIITSPKITSTGSGAIYRFILN